MDALRSGTLHLSLVPSAQPQRPHRVVPKHCDGWAERRGSVLYCAALPTSIAMHDAIHRTGTSCSLLIMMRVCAEDCSKRGCLLGDLVGLVVSTSVPCLNTTWTVVATLSRAQPSIRQASVYLPGVHTHMHTIAFSACVSTYAPNFIDTARVEQVPPLLERR